MNHTVCPPDTVEPDCSEVDSELPLLAFIHVPKTAGTSITNALRRAYGKLTFPGMTTLDYRHHDEAALAGFRLFKGHAYRCDYHRLPIGTIRFTVLRDPVHRAISYFNYYRSLDDGQISDPFVREACRLAKTQSIIEFIYSDSPFVIEHLRLGQIRQFLPEDTLTTIAHRQFLTRELRQRAVTDFLTEMLTFKFIMTCESLSLSFPLVVGQLGLPPCCYPLAYENVSQAYADIDSADVRRAMTDVDAAEFECYDYARQRETAFLYAALASGPQATSLRVHS